MAGIGCLVGGFGVLGQMLGVVAGQSQQFSAGGKRGQQFDLIYAQETS
jgi:hypothetical protein